MKPYSFTFAIALILTFTILVQASCSGCSERAVPISPSGIAGGNTTIYNTYNYYNSTYWYESGGWLYQNLTTAPNGINVSTVNTSQICISGNCQTTWPGGSGFLNSTWFEQNGWLVNNLTTAASGVNVTGANGNTYLTGNNINMDRAGPNYIQSTNVTGSLYLGAGGVTGIIGMIAGASINSIYINGDALYLGADGIAGIIAIYDGGLKDSIVINANGTGINNTDPQHALDVNGSVYANMNVSAPLLNASCIILDNEQVCNWTAINGSLGSGTFNETEGVYVYNSTPYLIDFNASKMNETIDSRLAVTTFYPNETLTTGGTNTTGNLTLLWWYDEETYNITEGNGPDPLDFYVNFTEVDAFSQLAIREYYDGSASHYIQVQVWDYDELAWHSYFEFVGQNGFTIITVPVYDAEEHIGTGVDEGIVQVRLHHVQNGISSHRLYVDFVWLLKGGSIGASTNLDGYAEYSYGWNNFTGYGNFSTTGNIDLSGNLTNPANSTWGYYNDGDCIVIGNLSYVSEC